MGESAGGNEIQKFVCTSLVDPKYTCKGRLTGNVASVDPQWLASEQRRGTQRERL